MCKSFKVLLIGLFLGLNIQLLYVIQQKFKAPRELNVSISANVENLDPAVSNSDHAMTLMSKVYEGLLEYHYLKRPYELIPNLAVGMPTVSEDGRTYTFLIQKGIYFHNNPCFPNGKGRELVAEDVVYSFKRIADPAIQSPYFEELQELIHGFAAFHQHLTQHPGAYDAGIPGIRALDRYTVQFTLTKQFPLFLHYMASSYASIVPKEAVDHYGTNFMNHPVGTGPFTLDAFVPQATEVVFFKNPTFRAKYYPTEASPGFQYLLGSAGKKLPLIDKLVCHILTEAQHRFLQFKRGKLDVLEVESAYLPQIYEQGKFSSKLQRAGIQLLEAPRISFTGFYFNCGRKPLNDQRVRQAISLAFDRKTYNKFFESNLGTIAHSFIPSLLKGYDKNFYSPYTRYDLGRARQLLAEAGYPQGKGLPVLKLHTTAYTTRKSQAEFFAKCMAQIGMKIELEVLPFPELLQKFNRGECMVTFISWSPEVPDVGRIFKNFRYRNCCPSIALNDAPFNRWYDRAVFLPDDVPEKTALYEKLNEQIAELVAVIPIPLSNHQFLVQKRIKNYCISPYHYCKELYVDVEGA
ncbi:MAG TPA: ABC transporter substrate-binding protein [Amoebophilaceae bacterium]|jgi:ABC-type transport system substrate-binding protein|nr:ABC transporter substrate-binding protein [Amoebophilaceae bacterium]